MKTRTRYSLLGFFILAFLILTPLMVLYVTGTRYDFQMHRFIKTGVIYAKTDPKGAQIFLNGASEGTTPSKIRFLSGGDYSIGIKKDGYFNWDKRLTLQAGFVTYVNKDLDNLVLYKSAGKQTELSDNVLAMSAGTKYLLYLKSNLLELADSKNLNAPSKELNLNVTLQNAAIVAATGEDYFLLLGSDHAGQTYAAVFDAGTNKIYDISGLVPSDATADDFEFNGNSLFQFKSRNLIKIDWQNFKTSIILNNVAGYGFSGDAIYYISGSQMLRETFSNPVPTVLVENLPTLLKAKLYLTKQNQIFVLGDNNLYVLGDSLNLIAQFVREVDIDNDDRKVMYATGNEIDIYDLVTGSSSLLTRTSAELKEPQAFYNLGWVFYIGNGRMQNIEIDSRDHQNNYTFTNVSENSSYYATSDAKNLILLNDGKLTEINIR